MLNLQSLFDPDQMNQRISPRLRWPLGVILLTGFGLCAAIVVDVLRHWNDRPHPVFESSFITIVGIAAAFVAIRLFRGDRLAGPVERPPRPGLIRALGVVLVLVCGPLALAGSGWVERIELAGMALAGLGFVFWPTRFFPVRYRHGA